MKPHKQKATATFEGVDGSLDFRHGRKYRLKVRFYSDGTVVISGAGSGCTYGSFEKFIQNWHVHSWS